RLVWSFSAVIVSGRSIFQVLAPAVAYAPCPELLLLDRPEEVLERSAVELPMPELLLRFAELLEPAVLAPVPVRLVAPVPAEELLVLRSVLELVPVPLLEDEPIPPLVDEEPERPLLDVPLASERRLPLLRLPLVLPDEFTGQLLRSVGLVTSPCTMVRSLN